VAYKTLLLRNVTVSDIYLSDIGISVAAGSSVDVTSTFELAPQMLLKSSLLSRIQAQEIVLNDGVSDIDYLQAEAYLQWYAVPTHFVESAAHLSDMQDSQVSPDDILARLQGNHNITGQWYFPNGLIMEYGDTLPTQGILNGRLYWLTTTRRLHVGKDGVWIDLVRAVVALYGASIVYEFAYNNTLYSGSYLRTSWAASNIAPVIAPRAGSLRSLVTHSTSSRSYTAAVRFYRSGSWQTFFDLDVSSGGYIGIVDNIDVDFNAGERIAIQVSSGRMSYPHAYLEVIWRQA
jgi:hypothetical protein